MKPSCITAPYRWPSPPRKTCPRRGSVSMSRRVRWGSTQLTAGPVDSELAALSPLQAVTRDLRLSPVQKLVRYVDKACSGLPNVSGLTRPSSAVDLSRSHFAGLIAVPIALGVRAVKPFVVGPCLYARRPVMERPRRRRSAVSDGLEDGKTRPLLCTFVDVRTLDMAYAEELPDE
jgi:hypothetical protein